MYCLWRYCRNRRLFTGLFNLCIGSMKMIISSGDKRVSVSWVRLCGNFRTDWNYWMIMDVNLQAPIIHDVINYCLWQNANRIIYKIIVTASFSIYLLVVQKYGSMICHSSVNSLNISENKFFPLYLNYIIIILNIFILHENVQEKCNAPISVFNKGGECGLNRGIWHFLNLGIHNSPNKRKT